MTSEAARAEHKGRREGGKEGEILGISQPGGNSQSDLPMLMFPKRAPGWAVLGFALLHPVSSEPPLYARVDAGAPRVGLNPGKVMEAEPQNLCASKLGDEGGNQ